MRQTTKKLLASFYMLSIATIAMTTVSYAWFRITKNPMVKDLGLTVLTETVLEMAPDVGGRPGEWSESLDLTGELEGIVPLKPITYIDSRKAFYAPGYHLDGRPSYADARMLSDSENGSVRGSEEAGYYIAYEFWMRTVNADAMVAMAGTTTNENGLDGLGTFLIGTAEDGASVASDAAVRLGFRIWDVDEDGSVQGEQRFIIYEPNANQHINGETGYIPTLSADGGEYYDSENYFIQNASVFSGTADASASVTPGTFETENLDMFELYDGKMKKITMYIWLEGQDVDCDNTSVDVKLYGNLQFDAKRLGNGSRKIESR